MSDDPFTGPDWDEFKKEIIEHLLPKMDESAMFLPFMPPKDKFPPVEFAVQIGYMILLEKPLIVVVGRDAKLPSRLALVADEIVEGEVDDPDFEGRFHAAIKRVTDKLEKEEK
jgi:hypothetical protein